MWENKVKKYVVKYTSETIHKIETIHFFKEDYKKNTFLKASEMIHCFSQGGEMIHFDEWNGSLFKKQQKSQFLIAVKRYI